MKKTLGAVKNLGGILATIIFFVSELNFGQKVCAQTLIDLDLGSDSGQGYSLKEGYAAIGDTTNDFWNFYDRVVPAGTWRTSGTVTNLEYVNGTASGVNVNVSDAEGAWTDASSDPMYHTYVYPLDGGDDVVTFSNLPAGTYDVLAYSPDGNFQVTVGGTNYGVQTSADPNASTVPVWTEGVQYSRWNNVVVGTGQTLVLTVRDGALSGNAILAGIQLQMVSAPPPPPPAQQLIDLDLGSDSGQGYSLKEGYAAIGDTTNDFWNFYDRVVPAGTWRTSGTVTNLEYVNGTASGVNVNVSDAEGAWTDASSDPMYHTYVYPLDGGDDVVTFSNLPAGTYDVLAYSPDGNFQVTVGGTNYGVQTSADPNASTVPVWTEGVQYSRWNNVVVGTGQTLVLTVRDGALSGNAILAGIQLQMVSAPPPPPPAQQLIDLDLGSDSGQGYSLKEGYAAIGDTTNDFWNFYDRVVPAGTWRTSGTVTNLEYVNGTASGVNVNVSDAEGAWTDASSDPMYHTYVYPLDGGDDVVTFSNLPAGTYDVLAYSPDGNFQVTVGGTNYGVQTSADPNASTVPVWTEGVQYSRWNNVVVGTGQTLVLTVRDGALGGNAVLAGVQIVNSSGVGPVITAEPANVSVVAGGTATFSVTATGPALSYQWSYGATNLAGATNTTLTLTNVEPGEAGNYAVTVSNPNGSVQSSNAVLTVISGNPTNNGVLLDLDLGSGGGRGYSLKSGYAAIGQTTNDFWNFYDRAFSPGVWRTSGTVTNLEYVNGTASGVNVNVSDAEGAWTNVSSDPMYHTYVYPLDGGNDVVSFSNLPAGTYDVLAYSPDGNFALAVGGTSYGVQTSEDPSVSIVPVWTEGVQYSRWNNVMVAAGQTLALTVRDGALSGTANLSGVQILSSMLAPIILTQPTNQVVMEGDSATFCVTAVGSALSYQWSCWGTNLVGATNASLTLSGVNQHFQGGSYAVQVSDNGGTVISSNAVLTVLTPPTLSMQPQANNGTLTLTWPITGKAFQVQSADSPLGPWTDEALTITTNDSDATVTLTTTNQQEYFRLMEE